MRTTSSTGTTRSPGPGSRWADRLAGRNLWPLVALAWLVLLYEHALIACLVPFAALPASWALRRLGFTTAAAQCLNVVAAAVGLWLVIGVWALWLK